MSPGNGRRRITHLVVKNAACRSNIDRSCAVRRIVALRRLRPSRLILRLGADHVRWLRRQPVLQMMAGDEAADAGMAGACRRYLHLEDDIWPYDGARISQPTSQPRRRPAETVAAACCRRHLAPMQSRDTE